MNLGTMNIDFCEPISLSEYTKKLTAKQGPEFNPFKNKKDQQKVNSTLAHEIVYDLQKNLRMMPTTMVSSFILLYRKGIAKQELAQKIEWLGMIINARGANFGNDIGLPG